jgi:hypothetical protein
MQADLKTVFSRPLNSDEGTWVYVETLCNRRKTIKRGHHEESAAQFYLGSVIPNAPPKHQHGGTNTTVGAMVNTFTIPGGSGYNNNLANAQVQHKWNASDNLTPWAYTTSNFYFSYYLQVPNSYFTGGAVGYVSTNPAYYKLLFISIQDEIAWPTGN